MECKAQSEEALVLMVDCSHKNSCYQFDPEVCPPQDQRGVLCSSSDIISQVNWLGQPRKFLQEYFFVGAQKINTHGEEQLIVVGQPVVHAQNHVHAQSNSEAGALANRMIVPSCIGDGGAFWMICLFWLFVGSVHNVFVLSDGATLKTIRALSILVLIYICLLGVWREVRQANTTQVCMHANSGHALDGLL
mmetsp:Transcript_24224/g.38744  ORF Transcript_24224/g.38744 Transcript_24224/m.38744 type:complete len:191 (-) Transcript_24224:154-726(-)